jgi:hypothetical protein
MIVRQKPSERYALQLNYGVSWKIRRRPAFSNFLRSLDESWPSAQQLL